MKEICQKVHFLGEDLSMKPRRYHYDHENKMIENSVNNVNLTGYLYNTWNLNKATWHRQVSSTSRKYLIINRKVENHYLRKEHSATERFKKFKLVYLN
jgi:hypothetical protein